MILQSSFDWIDFISKVIGSFIATLFTILVWFILEYFKERKLRKKLEENINRLYKILLKKELDIHTTTEVSNLLIQEIGIGNVLKILKMRTSPIKNGYRFEGNLYSLHVDFGQLVNQILISKGHGITSPTYDFSKLDEDESIFIEFITDFKKNCEKSKIKLKAED